MAHEAGAAVRERSAAKKWARRAGVGLLALLLVFVAACGLVYVVQDRFFFYDVKDDQSRLFLQGRPGYTQVEFTAGNGKTYHGMRYQSKAGKAPLVVYFGGNGQVSYKAMRNLDEQDRWKYFDGYSYLFIDYEGYGLNAGEPSYLNMYEEALAVYDYAAGLPDVDTKHIVSMGYSIGTGPAVYLAANRPVTGLVLAAPYANGDDLYNNALPVFVGPMKLLEKQKLPSDEYAPKVTAPVLVFASRGDQVVPFSSSKRLSTLFPGETEFVSLSTESHGQILNDETLEKVHSFLKKLASD